jgi:hypothetical protein
LSVDGIALFVAKSFGTVGEYKATTGAAINTNLNHGD